MTESYPIGGNGVAAGTTNYIYYNNQWQAIEVRTNGTANSNVTSQTVWSAAYINAVVLQDSYSGGVIQPNSRLYFQQDANWNTTAIVGLVSGSWQVTQRYVYSPYGSITVLNADWSTPPSGTTPMVNNLYQGMTLDAVTGLYYDHNRNYSPSLGTWTSQDPLEYINGANTYQFVMSNPVGNVDPSGLATVYVDPVTGASFHWPSPSSPTPSIGQLGQLGQLGGFTTGGWGKAIGAGTVAGFSTGFSIGLICGGPEGAVMGGLSGEIKGFIGGMIGYPVEKFVLGWERYYLTGNTGGTRSVVKE